jgi:flagellar protein FlgJ
MKLNIDPKLILDQAITGANDPKRLNRNNPAEVKKVCQQFEAIFIRTLIKNMRATVPDSGLLEKNTSSELFEEMMDAEIANQAARKGDFGIAEILYRQLADPAENESPD